MASPDSVDAMGIQDLDKDEFTRLYGAWKAHTPEAVAELFDGYSGLWWVAGGWAIEAFTGIPREHEDTDAGVLLCELDLLRSHLDKHGLDVWAASSGSLTPVLPGEPMDVPGGTNQVWTRRSAADPWEFDLMLSPGTPETWAYRRDPSITLPMDEALWWADGIRYLRPEIQLLYKAKSRRPKDEADFRAAAPRLEPARREWLRDALARTIPGHPWITDLFPR